MQIVSILQAEASRIAPNELEISIEFLQDTAISLYD